MTESSLLLRQIHPHFVQNGRVISLAFRPTPKDSKRLSVSDASKISPEDAWKRYTETFGFHSCGVLGVSVFECENVRLPVLEAPEDDQPDHMVIDFSHLESDGAIRSAAKELCHFAMIRGWLHLRK